MNNQLPKTIYNEARGEGMSGMHAVGSTIYNRANLNRSYLGGNNFNSICQKGYDGSKVPLVISGPADRKAYEYAQKISSDMQSGNFKPSNDCTHFDTKRSSHQRYEGKNFEYKGQQGNHFFWKEH